jgi:hypothetical protein
MYPLPTLPNGEIPLEALNEAFGYDTPVLQSGLVSIHVAPLREVDYPHLVAVANPGPTHKVTSMPTSKIKCMQHPLELSGIFGCSNRPIDQHAAPIGCLSIESTHNRKGATECCQHRYIAITME